MEQSLNKTQPNLLKTIWAHMRGKHISNRDFRKIINDITGQSSTKYLSTEAATMILNRLKKEKPRKPTGRPEHRQPSFASNTQKSRIKDLGFKIGFNDIKLDQFLLNKFGHILRMLPNKKAVKAIEALKSMDRRGYRVWHKKKTGEN